MDALKALRSTVLRAGLALAACALLGCALAEGPGGEEKLAGALPETTQLPPEWTTTNWDTGEVDDGWIARFGDPTLDTLVAEALSHNPNLQVAGARVTRAEGLAQLAEAGLQPVVGVGAQSSQLGGPQLAGGATRQAGLGVSWEADVWGRIRAGVDAAQQSLAAARADYESARLSLAGQTAKAWFLAQELRIQVQLAEQQVGLLTDMAALVRKNFTVGRVSREDVNLVEADLAGAQNALRQAQVAETQTVRLLELLLGRYPAASLETTASLVAVPPPVPAGMPSELLERRPDLVAAERRVAAAFRLQEQAELARMPRFTFSASLSGATALGGIAGDLLSGVTVPIYAPALQAQIAIATADQEVALAAYGQAVLRSVEEVETALFNDHIFGEREDFLALQVENNRKALAIHRKQLEVGMIGALPVLQVRTRYVGSQVLLTRVRNERLAQRVDLHLALGGSF
jgi:NodT family efflux transporter outer membrane factor (OMF) lipoprotein